MEKGTPNVRLSVVKGMVAAGKIRTTFTAMQGALDLGFDAPLLPAMSNVILAPDYQDFYKSMTAYHNHSVWHDVYKTVFFGQKIYLKLIVQDDVLIVSFKEL